LDAAVWDLTKKEMEEGLIRGPLSPTTVEAEVGKLWVAARRFGIKQGEKVRPIDNFSEFHVNAAFVSRERISLFSVDHVVSWSRAWLEAVSDDGDIRVLQSDGAAWTGKLHASWTVARWSNIVGRVADLKNAYKQLASILHTHASASYRCWTQTRER
jgi:hypothetical protein